MWADMKIDTIPTADDKGMEYFSRLAQNAEGRRTKRTVEDYISIFQTGSRIFMKLSQADDLATRREKLKNITPPNDDSKKGGKIKAIGTPRVGGSLESQIWDIVHQSIEHPETEELFESAIKDKLDQYGIIPNRVELVIKNTGKPDVVIGQQHKQFADILTCVKAGVNVALVGPAGSGKTTAVKAVAEALGLPFYTKSVSAQTGTHEFFGYQDAAGNYVPTLFRKAYEGGGVFLLDEFDAGNPNVLAALNQATANGECAFADRMVDKHEDFVVVMAGNTFGHGANSEYVGRNKIDAATLDRFAFIHFEYDEDFEATLCPNKEWVATVQKLRACARTKKIRAIISPRASINGARLLANGMPKSKVLDLVVYKGLAADEVTMLKSVL